MATWPLIGKNWSPDILILYDVCNCLDPVYRISGGCQDCVCKMSVTGLCLEGVRTASEQSMEGRIVSGV